MSFQLTRYALAVGSESGGVGGSADPGVSCSIGVRAAELFVIPPLPWPFGESGQELGMISQHWAEETNE